jgi:hypothetical protein
MKGWTGPRSSEKIEIDKHGRMQLVQVEPVFLLITRHPVRCLLEQVS